MGDFRYAQLCPVARAAELLGERWTLLVLRELFGGSRRFTDLRRRLPGVSPSVLTQRLARLERHGVIVRSELPPPASCSVYELGEAGRALLPALRELAQWGMRFLLPTRPGERLEPEQLQVAVRLFARRSPSPACRIELHVPFPDGDEIVLHLTGGPQGTVVRDGPGPADAVVHAPPPVLVALVTGALPPEAAGSRGLRVEGDAAAGAAFPQLFETSSTPPTAPSRAGGAGSEATIP